MRGENGVSAQFGESGNYVTTHKGFYAGDNPSKRIFGGA